MVLDVMLPGKDGFAVVTETAPGRPVRSHADADCARPSGRRSEGFRGRRRRLSSQAFRAGDSDRAHSGIAAAQAMAAGEPPRRCARAAGCAFTFGDKSIHFDLLELHVRGEVFPLTLMEANILRYLVEHEGKAVSRKDAGRSVGIAGDTDTRAIDNFSCACGAISKTIRRIPATC